MNGVVTINGGANFHPGGSAIGTTFIGDDNTIVASGRVLLALNSTNYFQVSPGVGNDAVDSITVDFGPSGTAPS